MTKLIPMPGYLILDISPVKGMTDSGIVLPEAQELKYRLVNQNQSLPAPSMAKSKSPDSKKATGWSTANTEAKPTPKVIPNY